MIRLQYEIRSEAERESWMKEDEARDHRLVESLDKKQRSTREWWMREANRRDEFMLC